jgi:CSLREA domain-containing protein
MPFILLFAIASFARGATFTVTKTADTNDGTCDADCSLREAIIAANVSPGADAITLPAGTYTLTIAGANEDASATGDLDINGDLTINGAGAATTIVDGGGLDRVFQIISGSVVFNNITIQGGTLAGGNGGGLLNGGTATVNNCVVSGNSAPGGDGGGIYNDDVMTIASSTITGNSASNGDGGGVFDNGLSITITTSTFSGNQVPGGDGGGIYLNGVAATVNQSTVSGNTATGGDGAGIYINGNNLDLTNCTITGNSAFDGGGLFVNGNSANFTAVTIAGNTATNTGGGIEAATATPQLQGTIVANNTGGNCDGAVTDGGTNLQFPGTTCGASILTSDPLLGPLADNGGPTQTMALGVGSPAIDANTENCPPPPVDQRGVARPQGAACDIGAFELQPGGGPTPTPTVTPPPGATATPTPVPVPPTATPTPPTGLVAAIPTLSGLALAAFAALLAVAAVFLLLVRS